METPEQSAGKEGIIHLNTMSLEQKGWTVESKNSRLAVLKENIDSGFTEISSWALIFDISWTSVHKVMGK